MIYFAQPELSKPRPEIWFQLEKFRIEMEIFTVGPKFIDFRSLFDYIVVGCLVTWCPGPDLYDNALLPATNPPTVSLVAIVLRIFIGGFYRRWPDSCVRWLDGHLKAWGRQFRDCLPWNFKRPCQLTFSAINVMPATPRLCSCVAV